MTDNWRTEIDAEDYFGHQNKKLSLADRRPVIRRASDLVGPGIAPHATPISDFNDALVTFNGYYATQDLTSTNGPPGGGRFVGYVVSDAVMGGYQYFTNISTRVQYVRRFTRNSTNPEQIAWSSWENTQNSLPSMVRKNPASDNTNTTLNATTWTFLTLPPRLNSGLDSTFGTPATNSISVLRSGLYTGSVTITVYGDGSQFRVYGPSGTTTMTLLNARTIKTGDTESVTFALDVATGTPANAVQFSGQMNPAGTAAVATISDFWIARIGPR